MIRTANRNYYKSRDLNDINDNKKLWTAVKPLFRNKIKTFKNITLDENDKLVRNEKQVLNIFNDFLLNIVPNLGINREHDFLNTANICYNPIKNSIYEYENNLSVIRYPNKLVEEFGCLFSVFIASNVNKCLNEDTYVDAFKKAEVRPLYKKVKKQENQTKGL